jgi:hypothetical protein
MARTATTFIARRPSAGYAQGRWAASAKELESAIAGTLLRWLIPGRARHGWCFRVRSRPPRFAPAVVDFDPAISETGQPSDYGPPNAVAGAAAFCGVLILLWVESLDQTQGYSVGLASTTKITGSALAAQLVLHAAKATEISNDWLSDGPHPAPKLLRRATEYDDPPAYAI